ncbi:MAG: hypothetical protein WCD21_15890, partial [Streptomyces sp.]
EVRALVRAVVAEALAGPVGALAEVTLVGSLTDGRLLSGDEPRTSRLHDAASLEEAFATAASAGTGAPEPGSPDVTQVYRLIEGSSRIAVQGEVPHLFVVDASQLPRREGVLAGLRRGDALLVIGEAPTGWRWRVGADGSLDTGPLGLEITRHAGRLA